MLPKRVQNHIYIEGIKISSVFSVVLLGVC